MSYDIMLTSDTHDLKMSRTGDLLLVDGAARVAQQVKVTLLTFLGEWFLDTDFGVPYIESILVKNPKMAAINAILRARIIDVPGVNRIITLVPTFDRPARALRVMFEVDTTYGVSGPYDISLSLRGPNG